MAPPAEMVRGEQAVDRVLRILGMFGERRPRLTVAEAAAELGVHRSTASRLMQSLERHRLLERAQDGGYVLGLGLVSLAGHVLNRFPVRAAAGDLIRQLRDRTGESTWLGVLAGDEVIYIDEASSPHVRVNTDWVGRRQSLTAGGTGALLLAFQPPEVIEAHLRAARRSEQSRAPALAERELARVRAQGYLARHPDPATGSAVVAAPVRDHRCEVVAAVTVAGPLERIDRGRFERELIPATLGVARLISERLGCPEAFSAARP
jgi:IclR family acetate operon transcriptional repressor